MFSSEKFLSPIVTGGLPAPGPLAAGALVLAEVLAELEVDEDFLLLPQAASAMLRAARITTDRVNALWWFRLLQLLPGIPRLLMLMCGCVMNLLGLRR